MVSDSTDVDINEPLAAPQESQPQTSVATTDEGSESTVGSPVPPSQRILIGSQRRGEQVPEAKPQTAVAEAAAPTAPKPVKRDPKSYPPPNIRDRLSPELEQEYLAALGGMSLDSILEAGGGGAPTAELVPESRVTCRVAKVHRDNVFVDLGGANQGVVSLRQFDEPPAEGSELELLVVRFNAEEGLYELSRTTAAIEVGNWDDVTVGQIVEVTVTGSNKGGLECQVSDLRGFIPMGQVSVYRVETPEDFVGQKLACVITEANRDRRNLVLSHRAVMERERNEQREKMLAELAPGQLREGVVRSIKDFGAFVDLGGLDGLIHVSQLSWDRVNHPSEVLEVGQKVKVRIDKFDADTGKISLSYREVGANPWHNVASKYAVGNRVKGVVSKTMDFGAFVKLEPGVEGMIHISELGHGRVMRVTDVVREGQEVEVKILGVDMEKQRISLSLKALLEAPVKPGQQKIADEDMPLPADAPKPPRKTYKQLKGGTGGPSGGEKFGLNW